jgi:flagellar protein FliO/FliZ
MTISAARFAVLFLLSVPLVAQTAPGGAGPVVYPAQTGAFPGAFPKEAQGAGFSPLAAVVIAGCAAAGIWLWWRGRREAAVFAARSERRLVVAETRALGNRQYLVVAAYDDKRYLLGVCPGRIEMLAPLDAGAPAPRP